MSYLMPPVSKCMRWQQSVSDDFVRPADAHSVLPVCACRLYSRLLSVVSTVCKQVASPVNQSTCNRVRVHGKTTSVGLVWPGQCDHVPSSFLPCPGGQTKGRCDAASVPVPAKHSSTCQRQGCCPSPEPIFPVMEIGTRLVKQKPQSTAIRLYTSVESRS